ncbi:hypothetical protein PFISCL1PPCAC_25926, partial [Pristionchus fissidentatus]
MMREFNTREELKELLEKEMEGDHRERPENNFLENSLKTAIAGEYTTTLLEVYGYPECDPQYIALVEHSEQQFPFFVVRMPLTGHNYEALNEFARLLLTKYRHNLRKYSYRIDQKFNFCLQFEQNLSILGEKFVQANTLANGWFFMDAKQRETILSANTDAPVGFSFEKVDADKDGEMIHAVWKYGVDAECTKNRLRHLPSICARNEKGEIVGWVMSSRFGQISNLYVLPEYRNLGLGKNLELSVAKEFSRKGMRVFKYVEISNKSVFDGSLRSPHWTLWMEEDEDNNETKHTKVNYLKKFKRA